MRANVLLRALGVLTPIMLAGLLQTGCAPEPPGEPGPDPGLPRSVLTAAPLAGAKPLRVVFDASGSSDPGGKLVKYEIDYGDEAAGAAGFQTLVHEGTGAVDLAQLEHTYQHAGSYTARLRVTDDAALSRVAELTVEVGYPDAWHVVTVAAGALWGDFSLALVAGRPALVYGGPYGLDYARSTTPTGEAQGDWQVSSVLAGDSSGGVITFRRGLAEVQGTPALLLWNGWSGWSGGLSYARAATADGAGWHMIDMRADGAVSDAVLAVHGGRPVIAWTGRAVRFLRAPGPTGLEPAGWQHTELRGYVRDSGFTSLAYSEVQGCPALAFTEWQRDPLDRSLSHALSFTRSMTPLGAQASDWQGIRILAPQAGEPDSPLLPSSLSMGVFAGRIALAFNLASGPPDGTGSSELLLARPAGADGSGPWATQVLGPERELSADLALGQVGTEVVVATGRGLLRGVGPDQPGPQQELRLTGEDGSGAAVLEVGGYPAIAYFAPGSGPDELRLKYAVLKP